jgi:hypothetical protein
VTAQERAVDWLAERVTGGDASYRHDVSLTTHDLCREASRWRQCLELLSLVVFALRLRSRASTGDQPDAVWRQGAYLGAVLLLTLLAAESAAAASLDVRSLGLAVALAAAAACALLDWRLAAAAIAAIAATGEVLWVARGVHAGALVSGCAIAIGGLLGGAHGSAGRHLRMALAPGAIVVVAVLLALVIGSGASEAAGVLVFAWIAPVALLVAGWSDPRLAAAATTIVFARLAASGFGELGSALSALRLHGQRELLVRWLAMGSSVVAAWLLTRRSLRHVARL